MAVSTSAIVGTIYFFLNTISLLLLGYYVYKTKSQSTNCFTYFWDRSKIFTTLIIVFLDSATDISVMISWYYLMTDSIDYKSVNMYSFFWPLIAFFILYQIILLFIACDSTHLYDLPLVIFQLFPFRAAYVSLIESHGTTTNSEKDKSNLAKAISASVDAEDVEKGDNAENEENAAITEETEEKEEEKEERVETVTDTDDNKKGKISPSKIQHRMLLIQCTLETLPGLVLQSVFWVRSFNDPFLAKSNNQLVVFSIIASLISVSARYISFVDNDYISDEAKTGWFNIWYIISIIYRILSIVAAFTVFVMVWVVIGGVWILLWGIILFVGWKAATYRNGDPICSAYAFSHTIRNMIALTLEYRWIYHLIKFIENIFGMMLVFIFLWTDFDCGSKACVSGETRAAYKGSNNRIAFLFALGWIAAFGQFLLYGIMYKMDVIVNDKTDD